MLTDIVEVIALSLVLILLVVALRVPAVLALADEATILVLYAVVAPEGGVSAATGQAAS